MTWQEALVQAIEHIAEAYEYQAYHANVTAPIVVMGGLGFLILAFAVLVLVVARVTRNLE